jgi:hypothetical protein
MDKKEISLLDSNGWDVICESPFEIEHRESGQCADGMVAKIVLQMIKDGVVNFTSQT